ncbi:CHASE domain-containing protein [Chitinimonas koreensis]|uniref:CHASE domain-containing protein n=1 Tax=Chitinimonas koreensis TaxID=356302 RepID=UPI0003F5559E|nr:CHASE domain-containing protein [Chitinimonas koreensis]QNM98233.1 CHASE domain-containing protein [Chitinimonas koreensis]
MTPPSSAKHTPPAGAWARLPAGARHAIVLAGLTLCYFAAARLGLHLAFAATNVSPVWPPSGIAVAMLCIRGRSAWPAVLLGAFAANLLGFLDSGRAADGATWAMSAGIALGNTGEALCAAWLIRRFNGAGPAFVTPAQVFRFAIAALPACAVSAAVGAACLLLGGQAPASAALAILETWWLGDVAGILVVAPLLLVWRTRPPAGISLRWAVEWLGLLAVLAALAALVFGGSFAGQRIDRLLAFLFTPWIGLVAYRHGQHGVTLAVLLLAALAVTATVGGHGPLAGGQINDALVLLDSFIVLWSVSGLALAADLSERRMLIDANLPARDVFIPWLILLLSIGLSILAWYAVGRTTEDEARKRFLVQSEQLRVALEERIADYVQILRSAAALFDASDRVSRAEWHAYVDRLAVQTNLPGVQGIGYAEHVAAADLDGFEARTGQDGMPGFRIRPAGPRPEYVPVTFIEPLDERNRRALGFDMYSEAVRREAIERTRDSGLPTMTAKVRLMQETQRSVQPGFLIYVPVYRKGMPAGTVAERRAAIAGYSYGPFRMYDLMDAALGGRFGNLELTLYDAPRGRPDGRLYDSRARPGESPQPQPAPLFQVRRPISMLGHAWVADFRSSPAFERAIDRQKAQIVLAMGIVISLLAFAFVRTLMLTRFKAQALAVAMTEALRESEDRFAALARTAGEGIVIVDAEAVVVLCNPRAAHFFGRPQQETVGCRLDALLPAPWWRQIEAAMRQLARSGHEEAARIDLAEAGAQDEAALELAVFLSSWRRGALRYYGLILHDVSAEKRTEREQARARLTAEASSRAKSDFLANMSHEIRTPLNAVLGMSQLLGATRLDPGQRDYLRMIDVSGRALLSILNDILDISKIEAGRLEIVPEAFELAEVVDAAATIMSAGMAEKELDVVIHLEPEVPDRLIGDRLRLKQVLINLTGNALKFTAAGTVAVRIALVARRPDAARLRFEVSDTGIGIAPEQLPRLFEPFAQGDSSTTRRFGGTGLGLVICRRLVALMGGEIGVDSRLGQGTTFRFELDFALPPAAAEPAQAEALRLLLVDDHAAERAALIDAGRALGWQVEPVALAALPAALAAAPACQALLLDWQTVRRGRLRLADALGAGQAAGAPAVVVLAAAHRRGEVLHAEAGERVDAILAKPATRETLLNAVQQARGRGAAPAAQQPYAGVLHGVRLLLVEDNELNRTVAQGLLRGTGAGIEIAENGAEAVSRLRERAGDYDLVLMDVQMPVMDGCTATRIIRGELSLALPIVAMTAGVTADEQRQCFDSGMDAIVAKPIERPLLIDAVCALLRRPRPATPDAAAPAGNPADAAGLLEESEGQGLDASAQSAEAAGFGLDDLAQQIGHDAELLETLMDGFIAQVRSTPGDVRSALEGGARADAVRVVHTLKGLAGSFEASRLVELAAAVERTLRDAAADAEPALAALEQEIARLLPRLEQRLAEMKAARRPG